MADTTVLMCPPTYFYHEAEIIHNKYNVHMRIGTPVDRERLMEQFERLRQTLWGLGKNENLVSVELLDPVPGLNEMVFAANGGVAIHGAVGKVFFPVNSIFDERGREGPHHAEWFSQHGFEVVPIPKVWAQDGEGELLHVPGTTLYFGGYGQRSDPEPYYWMERTLIERGISVRIVAIHNVDPHWYHLDTYFAPLGLTPRDGKQAALFYPGATDAAGQVTVRGIFEDVIEVTRDEAMHFICNSLVLKDVVIAPWMNERVQTMLESRGYRVISVDVSEYMKAGGQVKCMVLFVERPD